MSDDDSTTASSLAQFTDPDEFRENGVPFHVRADTVPESVVDEVDGMDDLAPTGVVAPDGTVLATRVEDDCALKIPCAAVGADDAYGVAAREWVEGLTGLDVGLDGVEGVWTIELTSEESDRTATRHFVVCRASPVDADRRPPVPDQSVPAEDRPAAGWYESLPDDAERPPGTDLFLG
ncbi:hypothetical protein [Haloarcula litorea]|uniref:hypothetical protein n=1 Tax=Haloarcula litorea TaxID=3032579 RepID=UPI0023E84C91|nr:hypothetical protein [Halomicroarcula sp. GDY20]